MAPSSWDASFLNSTSGLLSVLDLNQQQSQNMEDMDIDQAIDVPDTPDRLAARNINVGECVDEESKLSVAGHSGNSHFLDEGVLNQLRGRGRLVTENGHSRRLHFHPQRGLCNLDETGHHSSSIVSSSESSSASRGAHLFRRMIPDKISKQKSEHSIGAQHMEKGKALCTKFPIKPSACQENKAVPDSNEQNEHIQILEKAFPRGASKDPLVKEIRKGSIAANECSSLHSSKTSGNVCKGKERTDDAPCEDVGLGMDRGKGIVFSGDSRSKNEKYIPASLHSIASPIVTGQKRLVRNGCISPHNIARAKQFAERNGSGSKNVDRNDAGNMVSNGPSCPIDITDLIAEDNNSNRVKGKGVGIGPRTSKEHDARTRHLSARSSIIHNEEINGTSDASRDAFGCFDGLGGWRSTRNRSKKIDLPLSDEAGYLSGRNDGVGGNQQCEHRVDNRDNTTRNYNRTECAYPEVWDAVSTQQGPTPPLVQVASGLVSESDQVDGRHRVANTLIKRQKKHGSTLSNPGECSTSSFGDSEIVFLGSSGNPSNSRSTRNLNRRRRGILDTVIEIDELSPEIGPSNSPDLGFLNNDGSDTRARQVEADEILARELQEQLYQEVPVVGVGEIDAHLAWTLQQQEDPQHASSSGSHNMLHPRGSSISPIYRQSRSRLFQNPSSRRGTQARVPTSTGMAQLRSRVRGQPSTILSRERNLRFPLNMDLDMRIDILEALEAAVGDFSDMRMASHILQVQRDFNENDYEMLLALDENNHQHVGATVNQINSLPESTVRTDNLEEACAICLEIPTFGDTMRHLPCLHKFHKDCIDPWLSRRTSCPVCKSSIT